ncbi:heavy metal translocating P-type ATPase [Rhodovibrionaceae bacterium A322]
MSSAEPLAESAIDVNAYVGLEDDGSRALHLLVEGVHCGGCVRKIERGLNELPEVDNARLNMTTRRLAITWKGARELGSTFAAKVESLGYKVVPYEPSRLSDQDSRQERELLWCMAVAGFAAANVMLLSVAIWAGHSQGMGPATRSLLHWFSALIALPALIYAGRPFFRSAWTALKVRSTNMDVPISLAVVLASGMSLSETIMGGRHTYFDSAITLLFFLLLGRYLDRRARGKARSAAERLLALDAQSVTVVLPEGGQKRLPPDQVEQGMTVLVASGERISVDGQVCQGCSEVDTSLITGESLPRLAEPGSDVFAGTINLSAPLRLTVSAVGEKTLLAGIVRLMEVAEQKRARFVSLADRLSRVYAPVVHLAALLAFLGWWLGAGLEWQPSLLIAVAVLIITCPCALGLAVPAVQVIASGRLMRQGLLLKSGTALERLVQVDTVVFDKTGTLTLGQPELRLDGQLPEALKLAASLAANSRHPLARALVAAVPDSVALEAVQELAGRGLLRPADPDTPGSAEIKLGSRAWCGLPEDVSAQGPELWLCDGDKTPVRFAFEDRLRSDALAVVQQLKAEGKSVELLSGDRLTTVSDTARRLGIDHWQGALSPADKVARLEALAADGRQVLMVGDGLNDAPALAAASVSLSPASASDISQVAADAVFQGERLYPVLEVMEVARRSESLVKQNFALALLYNLFAVPLAIAGFVTPLVAAICMSTSSLIVIGNSLRLTLGKTGPTLAKGTEPHAPGTLTAKAAAE